MIVFIYIIKKEIGVYMSNINNIVLQLFLGQIPEAIYFALFMIFTKDLKEKRLIFIGLTTIEYLLLKMCFPYNIWFQIIFTIMIFILLKVLYKEKAQITDIFTFGISSLILTISSVILYFIIWKTINNFYVYVILNRLFLALFLYFTKNKLCKIENVYKFLWNRNDKVKKKIKSTTFRAINIVAFNLLFYIINLCMLFTLVIGRGI